MDRHRGTVTMEKNKDVDEVRDNYLTEYLSDPTIYLRYLRDILKLSKKDTVEETNERLTRE